MIKTLNYFELKGIVHLRMEILSFTHPQVVPSLYDFLPYVDHRTYLEEYG